MVSLALLSVALCCGSCGTSLAEGGALFVGGAGVEPDLAATSSARAARRPRPRIASAAFDDLDLGEWGWPQVEKPLEVPLKTLPMPARFVGGDYHLITVVVRNLSLLMLLDTGLTMPVMLTPDTVARLGLDSGGAAGAGTWGVGATGGLMMEAVVLPPSELRSLDGRSMSLKQMTGVVQDFPQRKIGEEVGIGICGMLGQGFLDMCDVELDARAGLLRAWPPGQMPRQESSWRLLPALRLPGSLQGVLLSIQGGREPVVGIVDTGASHTVLNTKAAAVLGLEAAAAASKADGRIVRGLGLDGTVLEMPLVHVGKLRLCGASEVSITVRPVPAGSFERKSFYFGATSCPPGFEVVGPLNGVELAVGDIGFFDQLLTDGQDSIGDFSGAAALVGQDILGQLPMRVSAVESKLWFRQSP